MAKFRAGNLVLTSGQSVQDRDFTSLLSELGDADFATLDVSGSSSVADLTVNTTLDVIGVLDVTGNTNLGLLTLLTGATVQEFSTDGTLVGDSDIAVPTEQAVKTYVDTKIGGAVNPGIDKAIAVYEGTDSIKASTATIDADGNIFTDSTSLIQTGIIELLGPSGSGSVGHSLGGNDFTIHNDVVTGSVNNTGTNSGSSIVDMIKLDPNGPVELYYDGTKKAETDTWGMICTSTKPTLTLNDGNQHTAYLWTDSVSGDELVLENLIPGEIKLRGFDSTGINNFSVLRGLVGSEYTTRIYNAGDLCLETSDQGIDIHSSGSYGVHDAIFAWNGAHWTVRSQDWGADIYLTGEDSGGNVHNIVGGDPGGACDIYHDGSVVASTTANGITGAVWG